MKNDRCCGKCRTPFQICGLKRQCKCHIKVVEVDIAPTLPDPTPKPAANVAPLFQEPTS